MTLKQHLSSESYLLLLHHRPPFYSVPGVGHRDDLHSFLFSFLSYLSKLLLRKHISSLGNVSTVNLWRTTPTPKPETLHKFLSHNPSSPFFQCLPCMSYHFSQVKNAKHQTHHISSFVFLIQILLFSCNSKNP